MSQHTYNAPLSIAKTGRELHVLIAGDLRLFTTRDSLLVTVEQIVNSYNACAGMSDPAKEIRSMREQSEMFRYLCKVTHAESPAELKDNHCFMGIDGKTHWGKTFEEAVRKAMNHDKGVTP